MGAPGNSNPSMLAYHYALKQSQHACVPLCVEAIPACVRTTMCRSNPNMRAYHYALKQSQHACVPLCVKQFQHACPVPTCMRFQHACATRDIKAGSACWHTGSKQDQLVGTLGQSRPGTRAQALHVCGLQARSASQGSGHIEHPNHRAWAERPSMHVQS